eukprot:UN02879
MTKSSGFFPIESNIIGISLNISTKIWQTITSTEPTIFSKKYITVKTSPPTYKIRIIHMVTYIFTISVEIHQG